MDLLFARSSTWQKEVISATFVLPLVPVRSMLPFPFSSKGLLGALPRLRLQLGLICDPTAGLENPINACTSKCCHSLILAGCDTLLHILHSSLPSATPRGSLRRGPCSMTGHEAKAEIITLPPNRNGNMGRMGCFPEGASCMQHAQSILHMYQGRVVR